MAGTEGTLLAHAQACSEKFNELSVLEARDDQYWAENQNARFHLWTSNIGVFASGHASSDYRLAQHPEIFQAVTQLLMGIEANLKQLIQQYQDSPAERFVAGEPGIEEQDGKSSSSKSSSLHSTTFSSDSGSKPALDSREQVEVTIRRLHTVARSIRRAGTQKRDIKAEAWTETDKDGNDLTSFFTHLAMVVMEYRFPDVSPNIRLRLAQSIAQRRNRIAYARRHQQKLNKKPPLARKQEITPVTFISGQKMSLPAPSLISVSKRSNAKAATVTSATSATQVARGLIPLPTPSAKGSSRASTVISGTSFKGGGNLVIPDPPNVTNKEDFQCPYCTEICPAKEAAGNRWRNHLMRDLKPYICISEPCSSPNTPFRTIQDWVHHMQQDHPITQWLCLAPVHDLQTFDTQASYEVHMLEEHAGTFLKEELPDLSRLNLRTTYPVFQACPFCDFLPQEDHNNQSKTSTEATQITLQQHVASHLEELSLLSLHWLNEDRSGSSIEDSSIKVRAELLRKSEAPPEFTDPPTPNPKSLSYFDIDWKEQPPVVKDVPQDPAWASRYGSDENQNPPRLTDEWGFRWKDNTPPYEGHENDKNLASFPNHTSDNTQPEHAASQPLILPEVLKDKRPTTWANRLRERLSRPFLKTTKDNDSTIVQTDSQPPVNDAMSTSLSLPVIINEIPRIRIVRSGSPFDIDQNNRHDVSLISTSPSSPNSIRFGITRKGDTSSDYVSPVGSQFTSNEPPDDAFTLEDKLWDSRIEWPAGQMTHFIPVDDMNRLVTLDSIMAELSRVGVDNESVPLSLAVRILGNAFRLFTIVAAMNKSKTILNLLEEGLEDRDLPFVRLSERVPSRRTDLLCSRRRPEVAVDCISKWRRNDTEAFLRDQWWTLSPVFKSSDFKVKHYELDDRCILPYVEDGERGRVSMGGYSSVWQVRIHPAHQHFYPESDYAHNPPFAIKCLFSTERKDFMLEVEMLKAFSARNHLHLIRLLATYMYKGKYFLMFPWANANLRRYWDVNPVLTRTSSSFMWILRQCKGLCSGLMSIHEYRTTLPRNTSTDMGDNRILDNQQGGIYGRHGDIKPENILWLGTPKTDEGSALLAEGGTLALSDFGLTEFHRKRTRSMTRGTTVRGTMTYAPPDLVLHSSISRAYDIWSLGCVFLEFIIWVVYGTVGLNDFEDGRIEPSTYDNIADDCFYTIVSGASERGAIVRASVQKWMRELHESPVASQFVHDFVDMIAQSMLVIDPRERSRIGPLVGKLQAMIDLAEADSSYLIENVPHIPPVELPTEETSTMVTQSPPIRRVQSFS